MTDEPNEMECGLEEIKQNMNNKAQTEGNQIKHNNEVDNVTVIEYWTFHGRNAMQCHLEKFSSPSRELL